MYKKILSFILLSALAGCLGSATLHKHKHKGEKESLINVPDRPQAPDHGAIAKDEEHLKALYNEALPKINDSKVQP